MADTNGQGPPWTNVSANELVEQLARQVADQVIEMAAMRIYIAKLQQQPLAATPVEVPA